MIALIPVSSSAIAAIGYEGGVLAVLFHKSGLYLHPGVPAWVFLGLMAAAAKGAFYNRYIRGKYK
jgi:hypothetical protein